MGALERINKAIKKLEQYIEVFQLQEIKVQVRTSMEIAIDLKSNLPIP